MNDWLAIDRGRWASLTTGTSVARQQGKNALLEIRELYGMVALGEKILHTAHEVKTAQKHFRRLKYFFGDKAEDENAKFPELNGLVKTVRSVNGQEAIMLHNGGAVELVARSKNSGRGFTVDVLVLDEAQEMSEDALEALMPTTSAAPLGNPQWIFTGTPPGPSASGEVFTRVRMDALSGKSKRLSWHEWSVESGLIDLDDRTLWHLTNPALEAGRLQIEVLEGERARFSDDGFARERLGQWASEDGSRRAISEKLWTDLGRPDYPTEGIPSYAVAFSADGMRVAIAGAFRTDEKIHVELIGNVFDADDAAGLRPIADWFSEKDADNVPRWRKAASIVLSGRAGAGVLSHLLKERHVPERRLTLPNTGQYLQAVGMFEEACLQDQVTHRTSEGQAPLDASIAVVDKDKRGGWMATTPDGDETPVEAVSLALWGARTSKRKPSGANSGRALVL